MTAHLRYDVFLTYTHRDKEWVSEQLVPRLEEAQLKVLQEDLDYGTVPTALDALEQRVESSQRTVVVLTPGWRASQWISLERLVVRTDGPAGARQRLLPLLLERCEPPRAVAELAYADFTDPSQRSEAMQLLLRTLTTTYAPEGGGAALDAKPPPALAATVVGAAAVGGAGARQPRVTAPAADTEERSRAVRKALTALGQLGPELLEVDAVREAVLAYKMRLKPTQRRVALLSHYKQIHDQLHNVHVQCYTLICQEVKGFPKEKIKWATLAIYDENLANIIERLRDIATEESFSDPERRWMDQLIGQLDKGRDTLRRANLATDFPGLQRARLLLSRVLSQQPAYISTSLTKMAGELELTGLGDVMNVVLEQLAKRPLDNEDTLPQIKAGIVALDRLDTTLKSLIGNHDEWQGLDTDLRLIEEDLEGKSYLQLDSFWPDVEDRASRLYGRREEPWAADLRGAAARLEEARQASGADPAQLPEAVVDAFISYRGLARQRFYAIDFDLLKHCTKVARALDAI
jgi:hypothetical protein